MVQRSRRLLLACPLALLVAAAPAPAAEIAITASPVSADAQKVVVSGTAERESTYPSNSWLSLYAISGGAAGTCPSSAEKAHDRVYGDPVTGDRDPGVEDVAFPQSVAPGPFTIERTLPNSAITAGRRLCAYLTYRPYGSQPDDPPVEVKNETLVRSLGETVGWTVHGPAAILDEDGSIGWSSADLFNCSVKGSKNPDPVCAFTARYTISTTQAWARKLGLPSTTILSWSLSSDRRQKFPKQLAPAVQRKLWSRGAGKVPLIHRLTVNGPAKGTAVVRGKLGRSVHGLSATLAPTSVTQ